MKIINFIITMLFFVVCCSAQTIKWDNDATPLHRSEKALTDVIVHDVFSPPVASRIYVYANIAAYEVLVQSNNNYISLQTQLNSFPVNSCVLKNKISSSLAAVYSFLLDGKQMFFLMQHCRIL